VKNKNGQYYKPDSLRDMIAALDRRLKDKQYPFAIVKDREFHSSKQVLERKAKKLEERRRSVVEGEQVRKYNPRGISKHNVVVTYPAFWAPRPARTSRRERG